MGNEKATYQKLCDESGVLIFQTPAWLNVVAGEKNWDVVLASKGNNIVGAYPFVIKRKWGVTKLTQPVFTPHLGPVLFAPKDLKPENTQKFELKVISQLISKLPQFHLFENQLSFKINSWLPYYWKNFKQTTKYTYILDCSQSEEELFKHLGNNIKKSLLKSKSIEIKRSTNPQNIIDIVSSDYKRKNNPLFFKPKEFLNIFQKFKNTNKLIIFEAIENGEVIAAICVVIDAHYSHYILGGVNINHRKSGAMSKLIWKAITESKQAGLHFNFEGSMNETIGRFFRSFGAEEVAYHKIEKRSLF